MIIPDTQTKAAIKIKGIMKDKGKARFSKQQHLSFQHITEAALSAKHLALSRNHCSVI